MFNVLMLPLDANHLHQVRARNWLEVNIASGWASCSITQNGCIPIRSFIAPSEEISRSLPLKTIVRKYQKLLVLIISSIGIITAP